jgi:hypothetical protein
MAKLSDRIETVLNESRMLLLGGQVLLGFTYRICFETAFDKLPPLAQYIELFSLSAVTLGLSCLLWPATFHRIAEHGWQTQRVHRFTNTVLDWSLLPFCIALGLSFYPVCVAMRVPHAAEISTAAFVVALGAWYGAGILQRRSGVRERLEPKLEQEQRKQPDDLSERIKKVLIECRMALPGAQAFLGFQFAIVFVDGFDKLPRSSQYVHFASLISMTLAIVLLITPAAYHRLAEAGEDTERFHGIASGLLLGGIALLAPGMAGELYIVMAKITHSVPLSVGVSVALLVACYVFWFGVSWLKRRPV